MCHSKDVIKFAIKRFLAGYTGRKIELFFLVLIHFCMPSNKDYRKPNGRRFIWNAVCMQNLKTDVQQENGVLSLKCGKQPGCYLWRHVCIRAYENKHSVFCLSMCFFLCYDFKLNTQGFVYLEFVKYQLGSIETCTFSQNTMYAYLLYSWFIYRHVHAFFLYWNKSYIRC